MSAETLADGVVPVRLRGVTDREGAPSMTRARLRTALDAAPDDAKAEVLAALHSIEAAEGPASLAAGALRAAIADADVRDGIDHRLAAAVHVPQAAALLGSVLGALRTSKDGTCIAGALMDEIADAFDLALKQDYDEHHDADYGDADDWLDV